MSTAARSAVRKKESSASPSIQCQRFGAATYNHRTEQTPFLGKASDQINGYGLSRISVLPAQPMAKLNVGHPDDDFEREAENVANSVINSTVHHFPLERDETWRFRSFENLPVTVQRNGADALALIRRLEARQKYMNFIANAERYGLPVRFLRHVARRYTIDYGSSDEVNAFFNEMTLEEQTLRSVEGMSPAPPFGEASGIRTIYEESAHAFIDLMENDPRFKAFISAGERHYKGAPVSGRRVTSDPERVFNEAAANYVAHRVASWWTAFKNLSIYIAMSAASPVQARRIRERGVFERVRNDYNRAMAEVVFGYSMEGGFLGIGSEQAETSLPMTREMKVFLDRELLEGRIPDRFEQVAGFQRMLRDARIQLAAPRPPQQSVGRKAVSNGGSETSPEWGNLVEEYVEHEKGPGLPLDANARAFFEPKFGYDFSHVRIHADSKASESARAIDARAYTLGRNIVFGQGQYTPNSKEGLKLLAHELTHVVQQSSLKSECNWPAVQLKPAVSTGSGQSDSNHPYDPQHPEMPPAKKKDNKEGKEEAQLLYSHVLGEPIINGVRPSDVYQGSLGSCGLMAALASIASQNPKTIIDGIKPAGKDQWEILLYWKKIDSSGSTVFQPEPVVVNQDLPTYEGLRGGREVAYSHGEYGMGLGDCRVKYLDEELDKRWQTIQANPCCDDPPRDICLPEFNNSEYRNKNCTIDKNAPWEYVCKIVQDKSRLELWPALYEKAVAIFLTRHPNKDSKGSQPGGYDDLEGISAGDAMEIVTGKPAQTIGIEDLGEDVTFNMINAALLNGQPVVASISKDKKISDAELMRAGVYKEHAYTVIRALLENGKRTVELRNPWGHRYDPHDTPPAGASNDAEFHMDFQEYKQLFDWVRIGSRLAHN